MSKRVAEMNDAELVKYRARLAKKREQYALGKPMTAQKALSVKRDIEKKVKENEQPWLSKRGDVYSIESMHDFHLINAYFDKLKNKPEGWQDITAALRAEITRRKIDYMLDEEARPQ